MMFSLISVMFLVLITADLSVPVCCSNSSSIQFMSIFNDKTKAVVCTV